MSPAQLAFWIAVIVLVFLMGLAAQFRALAGRVLRLALQHERPALSDAEARAAVAAASRRAGGSEPADWLAAHHPATLAQLRWSRHAFSASLAGLLLLILVGRLTGLAG